MEEKGHFYIQEKYWHDKTMMEEYTTDTLRWNGVIQITAWWFPQDKGLRKSINGSSCFERKLINFYQGSIKMIWKMQYKTIQNDITEPIFCWILPQFFLLFLPFFSFLRKNNVKAYFNQHLCSTQTLVKICNNVEEKNRKEVINLYPERKMFC